MEVWGEAMPMTSDIPNPDGEGYQTYDKERVLVFGNVYGGGDVANVGTVKTETCEEITLDNQDSKEFTTSVYIYGGGVTMVLDKIREFVVEQLSVEPELVDMGNGHKVACFLVTGK